MSPFRKRKSEPEADEKARREARRKELSERLRTELRDDGSGAKRGGPATPKGPKAAKAGKAEDEPRPPERSKPKVSSRKPEATGKPKESDRRQAALGRRAPSSASSPRPRPRPGARSSAKSKGPEERGSEKKRGSEKRSRPTAAERRDAIAKQVRAARGASARGLQATGKRAQAAAPVAQKALSILGAALVLTAVIAFRGMALAERIITTVLATARRALVWVVSRLDRMLTPGRVVAALAVACAACMIVAQYVDYRGVQVGQPQYADVSLIAPPPLVEVHQAADNHSASVFGFQISVLVPVAIVAAALALVALIMGRRRLGRIVSLAGLAGVAITLLVDLPKGLDEGDAGLSFAGAHAKLSNGFYAELAASTGLVLCGLLLSLHLRPAGARPGKKRREAKGPRRASAVASRPRRKGGSPLAKES